MSKTQELLILSKRPEAVRPAQGPSDAFVERQKALAQQAARLRSLRRARLDAARDKGTPPAMRSFDVVRHRGSWRVLYLGKHGPAAADQAAAIAAAVEKAKGQAALGHPVQVRLYRTDGQVFSIDLESGEAATPAAPES